jgi:uncharacterized protein YecE (DUF72 family)
MTAGELRVGCSGWSYKDWRGVVYPAEVPQRRWFECYQELFDTVELNSTFLPASHHDRRRGMGGRCETELHVRAQARRVRITSQ